MLSRIAFNLKLRPYTLAEINAKMAPPASAATLAKFARRGGS